MRRWRTVSIGCGWLLCIWAVAAVGIWGARALRPSAEHVLALLRERPLSARSADERNGFFDELANALNRLDSEQRRLVQLSDELRSLYPQMSSVERLRFLEHTRPPGSDRMARAFTRMSMDRRRRYVNKALDDLDAVRPDNRGRMIRDGSQRRLEDVIQHGFMGQADAASTVGDLELQPYVEQTQRVLQSAN